MQSSIIKKLKLLSSFMVFLSSLLLSSSQLQAQELLGPQGVFYGPLYLEAGDLMINRSYHPQEGAFNLVPLFKPTDVFVFPQEVAFQGLNFLQTFDGKLITFHQDGYATSVYPVGEQALPITMHGAHFYITSDRHFFLVNNQGIVKKVFIGDDQLEKFLKAKINAATFIVTKRNDVIIVDPIKEKIVETKLPMKRRDIKFFGPSYIITKDNAFYTLSFKTHSFVFRGMIYAELTQKGANYFTTSNQTIYTIALNGDHKVYRMNDLSLQYLHHLGANSFQDQEGNIFSINQDGKLKSIQNLPDYIRISTGVMRLID